MKKNYLFGLFAMASMLFTTSCQQDNLVPAEADTELVTFAIKTQDVATRAATGEGSLADNLFYGVYESVDIDGDGTKEWRLIEEANVADGEKQGISMTGTPDPSFTAEEGGLVTLRLARQKKYSIIFWAESKNGSLCDVKWAERRMYVKQDIVANAESYDAFWAYEYIESFSGAQKKEVTLTRPFAQLNIGVKNDDLKAANLASVDLDKSAIKVTGVPTSMSLETGAVGDYEESTYVTYKSALIPDAAEWEFPVEGNTYLALNYVLVDTVQSLVDIDLTYTDTEGGNYSYAFTNIPVQRNYRTNIYGNILTASEDYDVEINPDFGGNVTDGETIFDIPGLQAAIDAAPAGKTTTIYLGADLEGDVTIVQKEGVNIVIDGRDHKYNGTFLIHGQSRYEGAETLKFKNIKFATAKSGHYFIDSNSTASAERYAHNVTVEDCSFAAEGDAVKSAAAMRIRQGFDITVVGGKATDMHSLLQAYGCAGVSIDSVTIEGGKNGVSFGTSTDLTLTNSNITAEGYGVRADGTTATLEVSATSISAAKPVIVRRLTAGEYNLAIGENVTLDATGDYQIVFTNGEDDKDYVAPDGKFTLTGADDFTVYPVASASAFAAALDNDKLEVISLDGKVESVGNAFEIRRSVILNMKGYELNAGSTATSMDYAIEAYGDYDIIINDANLTRAGIAASDGADVVFNSGKITHKPERTSRYIFTAHSGSTITINDGTFTNDRAKNNFFWADDATIYVKGGNFGGVASNKKIVTEGRGQVIITGGTFNFDPTNWVAAGYKATKTGSTWTVAAE